MVLKFYTNSPRDVVLHVWHISVIYICTHTYLYIYIYAFQSTENRHQLIVGLVLRTALQCNNASVTADKKEPVRSVEIQHHIRQSVIGLYKGSVADRK